MSRQRTTLGMRLLALTLAISMAAAASLAAGCARFSAQASVTRALKSHRTALATISGATIAAEIEELSSPAYAGRQAGSPGGWRAADYIAGRFAAMGLQPLVGDSFFQEFPITYTHPANAPQAKVFDANGRMIGRLRYGQDVAYSLWSDSVDVRKAPVVFVGSWDRISAGDFSDKVLLALRPRDATEASLSAGLEQARAAGAAALLAADFPEQTLTAYWDVDSYLPDIGMLGLSTAAANLLLQNTGRDVAAWSAELAATAAAGDEFAPVGTGLTIDLSWSIDNDDQRTARNVVGVIPGTGGLSGGRSLLLTAHYDHLGALPDGPYWPGAWDNASGVAVMLSVAQMLAADKPDLNIIVAAWDAEERGLVGSARFAAQLPVPADSLVGVINLDCVGSRLDFSLERTRAGALTQRLRSAGARYDIDMVESAVKPWSDAASFQSIEGLEAIQIFDGGNPYDVPFLHDPADTIANLRTDALERIARTVALAILAASDGGAAK
ncbi:MAG: M28 family metallopeptidase [Chloroflexota bacterium]